MQHCRNEFPGQPHRGRGPANWTAFPTGYTTPASWLTIGPAAGVSQPDGLAGPAEIGVTPNATGLAPGLYGGLVEVRSDRGPSPQHVVGMLSVLPPGSTPRTVVEPGGLHEVKIVVRFWIVGVFFAMMGIATLRFS